ncbi:diguanylate cyclase [Sulfuriflexus mobilis]|uniref:diguanylate cyclase n=1 Tax=Sulfuriflexus mobilis TaxID=1811807 RepID=UPI000F843BBB|nr:diguanylate cyclase [Sulfuriflexus mobilis]
MTTDNSTNKCVVLLVDDQAIIAEGIRRMLENESDIIFHYCDDPTRAIQMATDIEATIILQDLVMPDIDGMTLVRFYRANLETRNIPIIVLSSKDEAQIKSDAFNNGANDYLVKLPDKIELLARIRAHSRSYLTQLERDAAFHALREMQKQLEETNNELQRLSALDGLTGLSNRRHFDEELGKEWRRAQRGDLPLSLILIDIDYFKLYNDTYGHLAGDECLQVVAKALQASIVRPADIIARYGGEEFVVILPATKAEGAVVVAENLRNNIADLTIPHSASSTSEYVSISLGIAQADFSTMQNLEALIEAADKGLYEAKNSGRNRYRIAS